MHQHPPSFSPFHCVFPFCLAGWPQAQHCPQRTPRGTAKYGASLGEDGEAGGKCGGWQQDHVSLQVCAWAVGSYFKAGISVPSVSVSGALVRSTQSMQSSELPGTHQEAGYRGDSALGQAV